VVGDGAGAALVGGVLLAEGCEAVVSELPLLHEATSRGTAIRLRPRPILRNRVCSMTALYVFGPG